MPSVAFFRLIIYPYSRYLDNKRKKEDEEYEKALERICKPKRKREKTEQNNIETIEKDKEEIHQISLKRLKENKANLKKLKTEKRKTFFKKILKFFRKK